MTLTGSFLIITFFFKCCIVVKIKFDIFRIMSRK